MQELKSMLSCTAVHPTLRQQFETHSASCKQHNVCSDVGDVTGPDVLENTKLDKEMCNYSNARLHNITDIEAKQIYTQIGAYVSSHVFEADVLIFR